MWLCRDGPQSRDSCDGCAVFRVRLRRGIRYSSLGPDPRRVPPITSGPGHHRRQLLWDRGAAVLQWLMGAIIESFGSADASSYPPEAYMAAFGLVSAGLLASILWYLPCARIPAQETASSLPG